MCRLFSCIIVTAFGLILSNCRDIKDSEFAVLSGRVFIFNYRLASATYMVTLEKVRPLPDGAMVFASFENPAGGPDILLEEKIWPTLSRISLESAPLSCVVKDKPYKFNVKIKDSSGNLLQELDSSITSTMDQTILPDRPLVVGQGYSANPELKGHPDGKLPGLIKAPCPA